MISQKSIVRPYPTGACAPSADALKDCVPLRSYVASGPSLGELAARDLMEGLSYADWPLRIQGQRQTCIAFAVSACVELLLARRYRQTAGEGKFVLQSPQFLYWHMREY